MFNHKKVILHCSEAQSCAHLIDLRHGGATAVRMKCLGYLKGPVQVLPYPVALNDLKDSSPRGQELGIGQIGSVHRNEDAGARYHLQLLME